MRRHVASPQRKQKVGTDLQVIMERLAKLPAEKQRKVLDFLEKLDEPPSPTQTVPAPAARAIWEIVEELTRQIPSEAWAELPTDGSTNIDHYLYGAPKK
jgi:hypothetical protein